MDLKEKNLTEIQTQIGLIKANLKTPTYLKAFSKGFLIGTTIATPIVHITSNTEGFKAHCGIMLAASATTFIASSLKVKKINNELSNLEKQKQKIIKTI